MVLLVHFSFIHQTVIESASPSGYSGEHKRQRFLFFWRLHWVSFFPPTNTLQWFPGAQGKVQTPLYGNTAPSGPGFLWGLGSRLACYHPTTPGRLVSLHSFARWFILSLEKGSPQPYSAPLSNTYAYFKIQESRVTKSQARRNNWSE